MTILTKDGPMETFEINASSLEEALSDVKLKLYKMVSGRWRVSLRCIKMNCHDVDSGICTDLYIFDCYYESTLTLL